MSSVFSTSTTLRIFIQSLVDDTRQSLNVTHVDRPKASTVTGGHVLVHGLDRIGPRHLTVLLVHVVGTGAGIVSDPDTEVLDLLWALLVDLDWPVRHSLSITSNSARWHVPG